MAATHLHRLTLLWGSLLILSSAVSAISPVPVSNMAYITIDENILLVQGGADPSDKNPSSAITTSRQFFSLDLTKSASWNTASPPWTQLNLDGDSGPASYGHSLSLSPNRRNITVWDQSNASSRGIWSFNLESHKWTKVADGPKELSTQGGLQAVTHPKNGLVYIPSGSNSNSSDDMLIFDLLSSMVKLAPNPPKEANNLLKWYGYSFVWSEVRKSFLIFGGGGDVGPYFYEYTLDDNSWKELPLAGDDVPPRVKGACMVPAFNGTKMLLFGGLTSTGTAVGSLYTLDVTNMAWSLSQTTQPNQNRSGMACSVSGDNFVVWGGQSAAGAVMTGTPLIYNINTTKWTQQFVRGTHYTPTPGSPDSEATSDSGYYKPMTSPLDVGGAITAGVAVVAVVGFIFYRRRKNRRQNATMNGQSHQFYKMQESDLSLNSIVSPPPIAGASGQDGSHKSRSADDAGPGLSTFTNPTRILFTSCSNPPVMAGSQSTHFVLIAFRELTVGNTSNKSIMANTSNANMSSHDNPRILDSFLFFTGILMDISPSAQPPFSSSTALPSIAIQLSSRDLQERGCDQVKPKVISRNPQGTGDIVVTGSSSSISGRSDQSNEELQQQVLALQAELSRLQATIGS
ncbi:hypothetical protein BGW39_000288 [Mortierella sp. 14UC]|nr:hypothetical protein BGW39_000288 [Mortierella sp. 14UC]